MGRAFGVSLFVATILAAACGDESSGGGSPSTAGDGGDASTVGGGAGEEASAGGGTESGGSAGTNGEPSAGEGPGGAAGDGAGEAGETGAAGDGSNAGSLLPSFADGSRLVVKKLASPEMPDVFVTFHDTELDTDCEFTTATDGTLRCLPRYTTTSAFISPGVFLDADCTERVAIGDRTCVSDADGFTPEGASTDACSPATRVLRTTRLEDGVPLYGNGSGDCVEQGTTNEVYRYFSVSEAPPSTFVEAETRIVETPTRLSVQRIEAEDGAHLTLSLADPETERECRVFERADGSMCVPAPAFSGRGYRYGDESCETPVSLPSCDEPLFVLDLDEVEDGYVYFHVGAEHTGDVYGGVSTCELVTGEGPFYDMGDPVDAADFPGVTATYEGTRRIQQLVYRDAAGTALATGKGSGVRILNEGGLFDTEFDAPCQLHRGPDLELYCVPEGIPFESPNNLYFADADCTEQVSVCGAAGCPADLSLQGGLGEGAVCGIAPEFVDILTLGEELELEEIYIFYSAREPGMQCDGPFSTEGYGVIRAITGNTSVNPFALTPLAP